MKSKKENNRTEEGHIWKDTSGPLQLGLQRLNTPG